MAVLTPAAVFPPGMKPKKAEIIQLLDQIQGTGSNPAVVKQTKAALDLVTPASENYGGLVLNDPDPAKNGYYYRDSEAWVKGRGLPDTVANVSLGGPTNAQTGVAAAGVDPGSVLVYFAVVATENTGPMTLSIASETPRDVVNSAGNALTAGEWTGTALFFINDDGDYQLLNTPGAEAAAAASATLAGVHAASAEGDADRAEAAAAAFVEVASNFVTVASLLADNNDRIGYAASGADFIVESGDVVSAQGFRYLVAASGASDEHLETAGGVKLYLADPDVHLAALGLPIDGSTAAGTTFSLGCTIAISEGKRLITGFGLFKFTTATTVTLPDNSVLDVDWQGSTIEVSDAVSWEQLQIKNDAPANGCTVRMRNFHLKGTDTVSATHWGVASATYKKNIGLLINAETIELMEYQISDVWGKALNIGYFTNVNLRNQKFRNVGGHSYTYGADAYGNEDSFGDAIYFNLISGDASVVIENIDAEGMLNPVSEGAGGGLSRIGIAFENDAADAASLTVEMKGYARLHNFERTFHFENHVDSILLAHCQGDVRNTAVFVHTYLATVDVDYDGWVGIFADIAFNVDSFFLQQVEGTFTRCTFYNPTKMWDGNTTNVPSGINVSFIDCDLFFNDARLLAKNSSISLVDCRIRDFNDDDSNATLAVTYQHCEFTTTVPNTFENVLSSSSGAEGFYDCVFTNQRPASSKTIQACKFRFDSGVIGGSSIRVDNATTDIPRIPKAAYIVHELDTGTVRVGYVDSAGSIFAPGTAAIQAGSTGNTVRVGSGVAFSVIVEILPHQ